MKALERTLSLWHRDAKVARLVCAAALALLLGACGGGGEVVVAEPPPPPPAVLGITVTRVAYYGVQVDWGDDPHAHHFVVERNGAALADVIALSVVDYSVTTDVQYCYRVFGYDDAGDLVSYSDVACIVLAPG